MSAPLRFAAALALAAALLLAQATAPARAETDYFGSEAPKEGVTFRVEDKRTRAAWSWVGGLGAASAIFGGAGLYFHLDSKRAADELSTTRITLDAGLTYTADREALREDGLRSRKLAIGAYAIGGSLLIATLVAFIKTEPASREVTVKPTEATTSLVPIRGGAFAARSWRF